MLLPYIGDLDVRKVHDDTLRPFIDARLAKGKSPITINRTLEVARAILNRAARAYRDADGFRGWKPLPRLSRCCPSPLAFRIRSTGMSKTASFGDFPTICPDGVVRC